MTEELPPDYNATFLLTFHEWTTLIFIQSVANPVTFSHGLSLFYVSKVAFKRPHKNQWKIKDPGQEFQDPKGMSVCKKILASRTSCVIWGNLCNKVY